MTKAEARALVEAARDFPEEDEELRQEAIRGEEEAEYMGYLEVPKSGWGRP